MRRTFYLGLAMFCVSYTGNADVILFKNGDQLTGDWVRIQQGQIAFKAETVGDVNIPIPKVKSFASAKQAVLVLQGAKTARGQIALRPTGDWEVQTEGKIEVLAANTVEAIYPREGYEAKAPDRRRKPWQDWQGSSNVGYNMIRGEPQARTISIAVNATRRQPDLPGLSERFRTNYFLNLLLASTTPASGVRSSANSFTSGLRQDFLFTPTNFVFLLGQLDHIQAQGLDLRQTYGLGLGRDLLRSRRVVLSSLVGTTIVREKFKIGIQWQKSEGLLGEKVSLRFSDRVSLDHFFNLYPGFIGGGRIRIDTTSSLNTRLASRLSFNTTFTNRFLSQPQPGGIKNEVVLTTGLGFHF